MVGFHFERILKDRLSFDKPLHAFEELSSLAMYRLSINRRASSA